MNVADLSLAPGASVDAIPRDYNFAADILARNLDAGRAGKAAFIDHSGNHSYGALAERVERFGHALRALGIRREERILICLTDTIDWPTAFLGAMKAGVVAVPVNTLLTDDDYAFMLEDSRARLLIVSEELLPKFKKGIGAAKDLAHIMVSGDEGQSALRRRLGWCQARSGDGAHHARRYVLLALHVGLDRPAEGRSPHPRRSQAHRRALRAADSRHCRERCLLLGRQAVFRLRSRQRADLSDVGRRHHGAVAVAADAGGRLRTSEKARRHDLLCGPDFL